MLLRGTGARALLLGALVVLGAPTTFDGALAAPRTKQSELRPASVRAVVQGNARAVQAGMQKAKQSRFARTGIGVGFLQCVPFARENSGIEIVGNAATWWYSADGVYERGSRPEVGSVLNFRANQRSRLGHVAVVTNVLDPRTIEIDHANWSAPGVGRGRISRNIAVVDVSENNDWTAVRVEIGQTDNFGSIYPTFGFIYDRPDRGVMLANTEAMPPLALDAPLSDFRPAAERYDEVAEAPDDAPRAPRPSARTRARSAARADVRPPVYRSSAKQASAVRSPASRLGR